MKAAVYYQNGGPEVFQYEEVPAPEPKAGEVLLAIEAISIEGGDSINRESRPLFNVPNIVGYQCAGTIVKLGPGVTDRQVGQRVLACMQWGSHAEYVAVLTGRTFPLPDNLDIDEAAAIPTAFFTAYECLVTAGNLQAGETVLIHGATGFLGLAAIQLAKQLGATVISAGANAEKLQKLKDFGSDHEINISAGDYTEAVMQLTGNKGVNLVIDPIGGANIKQSVTSLTFRGIVVFVGVSGRDNTLFNPLDLWRKNASLKGVYMPTVMDMEQPYFYKTVSHLISEVAEGKLKVPISAKFKLSEVKEAYQYILDRKAFGRVLLKP
jgi:NADPH2:quinone reductase